MSDLSTLELLAEALGYPSPARLKTLSALEATGSSRRGESPAGSWTLGEWEEHYTRVFDHNPPSALYLGYQMWGDRYQRGELMATLARAQKVAGVDPAGELPDHLVPVLLYLAAVTDPLPQVLEILPGAVEKIRRAVEDLAPGSPYLAVLDDVLAATKELSTAQPLPAGRTPPQEGRHP